MKDERTPAQKYQAWINAVNATHAAGWTYVRNWVFKNPAGNEHDLSAIDLTKLHLLK